MGAFNAAFNLPAGSAAYPTAAQVLSGVEFGPNGTDYTGTVVLPSVGDVQADVTFGASSALTGTFAVPAEAEVEDGVGFGAGGTEFTGTLVASGGSSASLADIVSAMQAVVHGKRCIYVSKSGSDSNSGLTPALAKLTLGAAKVAASAGDLIIVAPGDYSERDLLKDGVEWYFPFGANVVYSGAANGAIFDDSANGANGAVLSRITGRGRFVNNGTGNSNDGVYVNNASSVVTIEADEINATARGVAGGNGVVVVNARKVISDDGAIDNLGATMFIDVLDIHSRNGFAVELDTLAPTLVDARYVHTDGSDGIAVGGNGPLLQLSGAIIEGASNDPDGVVGIEASDGLVHLVDCAIHNTGDGFDVITAGGLTLSGVHADRSEFFGSGVYDVASAANLAIVDGVVDGIDEKLTDARMGKIDLIGSAGALVELDSPMTESGSFAGPLVIGDDYLESIGRSIEWTITSAVAPASAKIGFRRAGKSRAVTDKFTLSASSEQIESLGSNQYRVHFDLPGSTTTGKTPDNYEYQFEIRDENDKQITFYHSHFFAADGTPARNYMTLVERFVEES